MRVLVLGGTGRIGTMLRRFWSHDVAQGTDLTFIYQTRHPQNASDGDLVWDILAPLPDRLIRQAPFDCMIVLAGIVPRAGADLALNIALGQASLEAASRLGIPRVLLASSSAVYGTSGDAPLSEEDPCDPVNAYGRAKLAMEDACRAQARRLGLELCALRIGNVAGADALLLNGAALEQGARLQIDRFTDGGTPVRSYIGPHSLGRVLLTLLRSGTRLPGTLNIAAPRPVSMGALAQAAHLPATLHPVQETAHQYITLDCTRLAALHRFDPAEADPGEMVRQWQASTDRSPRAAKLGIDPRGNVF